MTANYRQPAAGDIWPEIELPPLDLPYPDGQPLESPWHFGNALLLVASYVAAYGGRREGYFVGANIFSYHSIPGQSPATNKADDVLCGRSGTPSGSCLYCPTPKSPLRPLR